MREIANDLYEEPLFAAICEGARWWFWVDGPQTRKIGEQDGALGNDDVRRIALTYNFSRNMPKDRHRISQIAEAVNAYRGQTHTSLDDRARRIEATILDLHSQGATAKRLVSGTTKLTWFVAPTDWTPFDRLAAAAVDAKDFDTVKRMRTYYAKLDRIGFLEAARRIDALSGDTPFSDVGGTRILDKLLMFGGEEKWTEKTRPIARRFATSLSAEWQAQLEEFARRVIADPKCRIDLEVPA